MIQYPGFDKIRFEIGPFGIRSAEGPLVRNHVPHRLRRRLVAGARAREQARAAPGSPTTSTTSCSSACSASSSAAASATCCSTACRTGRQGSVVSRQDLGGRHVLPRRLIGVIVALRDLRRAAQAQDRRRVRFRRAAAGHRHLRRAHRQLHQRRAVGQTHRRALGLRGQRRVPRHASQLYEAALEGLVLFVMLWWFTSKPRPRLRALGPVPDPLFAGALRRRVRARAGRASQ